MPHGEFILKWLFLKQFKIHFGLLFKEGEKILLHKQHFASHPCLLSFTFLKVRNKTKHSEKYNSDNHSIVFIFHINGVRKVSIIYTPVLIYV